MSDDLTAWLRVQLDEDERVARRAGGIDDLDWIYDRETFHVVSGRGQSIAARKPEGNPINDVDGEHIARHDPARVLAEVAAKRRIVAHIAIVTLSPVPIPTVPPELVEDYNRLLRLLAQPYAGRPGWREEWRA